MVSRVDLPRRAVLAVLLAAVLVAGLVLAADRWAGARASAWADDVARQTAGDHVGLLASELQKFRLLPLVLSQYPDVADALTGDAIAARRLDQTLEQLGGQTDAAAIYAIDPSGRTVAASNWRLPSSFVGRNYGFRPYFRDAMRRGTAELFALGTVSGRPGLYLARRVERRGRALGTIVVKVEFDSVETAWSRSPGVTFVIDGHGVILVTSIPSWRFQATGALDPATLADARRTLQFGTAPPRLAPLTLAPPDAVARVAGITDRYRLAVEQAPLAGARLFHLAPLDTPLATARLQALLGLLGLLIVTGGIGGFMSRSAGRRRRQRDAHMALEEEVGRRTAELSDANARLVVESQERLEADRRFRAAREELAQANRLGSIGQITAGVAHEINQPVASIRAFAENCVKLLDLDALPRARENLDRIIDLTARIGAITGELRAFARRQAPSGGVATLGSVIDGVMLLMGERARDTVELRIPRSMRDLNLLGDRIRLEQILINLMQNALEAVAGRAAALVTLTAARRQQHVMVTVRDNGDGLDAAIADTLFTPFVSAKPEGLGLGLAIARDIARQFDGDIAYLPGGGGASFVVSFRIAS